MLRATQAHLNFLNFGPSPRASMQDEAFYFVAVFTLWKWSLLNPWHCIFRVQTELPVTPGHRGSLC